MEHLHQMISSHHLSQLIFQQVTCQNYNSKLHFQQTRLDLYLLWLYTLNYWMIWKSTREKEPILIRPLNRHMSQTISSCRYYNITLDMESREIMNLVAPILLSVHPLVLSCLNCLTCNLYVGLYNFWLIELYNIRSYQMHMVVGSSICPTAQWISLDSL